MKISRRKVDILFIFVIFVLVNIILFMMYQSISLGTTRRNDLDEVKRLVEMDHAELNTDEQQVLDLVNEYREENGLEGLKAFSKLQDVAKLKAMDLVQNEYFSHNSERLGTPFEMLENNGVMYAIAGENLAGNISPENAVESWINSPLHRDNILEKKFEYTGICVIDSDIYGKVFVQLFIGVD